MPSEPYTSVRPEPGESVVLLVEGGRVWKGEDYDTLTLWCKTKHQKLALPVSVVKVLVGLGVGHLGEDGWFKVSQPTMLRFTRPASQGERWRAERLDRSDRGQMEALDHAVPTTSPPHAPPGAPHTWDGVVEQYRSAFEAAWSLVTSLKRDAVVEVSVNAIAFSLLKAATDAGLQIPVPLSVIPSALVVPEDDDDSSLPF